MKNPFSFRQLPIILSLSFTMITSDLSKSYGNSVTPSKPNFVRTLPTLQNTSDSSGLPNNSLELSEPNLIFPPSTDLIESIPVNSLPLSPGDQIRVLVQDGEIFSGIYEVNLNGDIQMPYLKPIYVVGLTLSEAQNLIRQELIRQKMFKPNYANASVSIIQWSATEVNVSGAVFQPGPVTINVRLAADQALTKDRASGDYAPDRSLLAAIRASGGITPMANIKEVTLMRNGKTHTIDISGVFMGIPIQDIPLIRGDQIIVPSLEVWQNELVRPSPITLPAVQIRVSNLTVPANSNSNSSVSREAITFPYGARFSQAVVSANCVGGTQVTNADRQAILVRTDRLTGTTKFYENSIENLMRNATDETNPFLMPDDGVACYDSTATNVKDAARTILDILSPIDLIKSIFGW